MVLIVLTALVAPAMRMWQLIDEGEMKMSRDRVDTWLALDGVGSESGPELYGPKLDTPQLESSRRGGIRAERITIERARRMAKDDVFLSRVIAAADADPTIKEFRWAAWDGVTRVYDYARFEYSTRRAVRAGGASSGGVGGVARNESGADKLTSVVIHKRRSIGAFGSLWVSMVFLIGAGALVLLLAVLVFYLITHKIILQPVRTLKETAERVREGNVAVRSEIKTGDEFEQLAQTFNMMLSDLQMNQDRLRALNQAMDVKLHEMAESNTLLHESTKLKGEFLANVSHELRTPLNSIIGFAELLLEQAKSEGKAEGGEVSPPIQRRVRYLTNIDTAGRNLLTHINSLLEMARIEAGRVDVQVVRMNLRDACEGLLGLIHPLADRKGIELKLEAQDDVPNVNTDQKKFQQIIFNFLSNAVKFMGTQEKMGRVPQIVLRVEKLVPGRPEEQTKVRVSVIDNGPGIPEEEQAKVFEKFYQIDAGHTRETTGTGLGLAICKELANILQCEIQLVSGLGRGSMFSLIMPLDIEVESAAEGALEAKFRGALTGGRTWA